MMNDKPCSVCSGTREAGSTTFTVDYETGLMVVRNVPALICKQCGEEWIADDVAAKLEGFADIARREKKQIEVIDFGLTEAA